MLARREYPGLSKRRVAAELGIELEQRCSNCLQIGDRFDLVVTDHDCERPKFS
jgi:hypothetical protein